VSHGTGYLVGLRPVPEQHHAGQLVEPSLTPK
jgi:hypothetical protein